MKLYIDDFGRLTIVFREDRIDLGIGYYYIYICITKGFSVNGILRRGSGRFREEIKLENINE